ncbi:MAG: hypothetical protein ACI4KF_00940 [Huintestinicola sp.]
MKKKILIPLAAMCACAAFTACGVTTLDPQDFCDVDVRGANGYGKVSLSVDYSDLRDELEDCLGDDSTKKERQKASEFADTIKFKVISDKEDMLSNGDVIEVEIDYDEEDAKKDFKFRFKSNTFKYKVEDLDDAEDFDPFEGLTITYEGFSPNGRYQIDYSKCSDMAKSNVNFEVVDSPERVANGDTITIKATCRNEEALLEEGYVLSADTKQFTVSGLEEGKVLDAFANIKIDYSGISPWAQASVDTSACEDYIKNNVTYRIENNGNIANGDNVLISIRYDESKAEQNGIVFAENEKTVVAEGVPVYLSTYDGVNISELDSQYYDFATQKLAKDNWYTGSTNKNINYLTGDSYCGYTIEKFDIVPVKRILLTPKNFMDNSTKSYYSVIYRLDGKYVKTDKDRWCKCDVEDGATVNPSFYIEVKTKNMAVNADGSINTDKMGSLDYYIYWPKDSNYSVSLDTICESWRAKNASDYNVSITDVSASTSNE